MTEFEKKFGKYAINNLPLIMILCYGAGYLIQRINPQFLYYLSFNPYAILHGQVWRLLTWIILPPGTSNFVFTLLLLFCVFSIGSSIERIIGTYQFNIYILLGLALTMIGNFLLYGVYYLIYNGDAKVLEVIFTAYSPVITSYYIYLSLFVVFALSFPDAGLLFMFFIPIKAKWLVIIYVVEFVVDFYQGNNFTRACLIAALVNFLIFWLRNKNGRVHLTPKQKILRTNFNKATGAGAGNFSGSNFSRTNPTPKTTITRHKCAICGCTEIDKPDMQFRFCSKCNGNYEYCETHLYTHTHVGNGTS